MTVNVNLNLLNLSLRMINPSLRLLKLRFKSDLNKILTFLWGAFSAHYRQLPYVLVKDTFNDN